jgi:muramoyltetrapeptide carboxypeptidase LdcA involved in peptidoglycan recycling
LRVRGRHGSIQGGTHALGRHTYLSGTDDERLADLNTALRDEEVRGILCLRGGYGVQRIVDGVDFAAFAANPKLVMGFSDITALKRSGWLNGVRGIWNTCRTGARPPVTTKPSGTDSLAQWTPPGT